MTLWFTLFQKMKPGDLFKAWFCPEGTCHLKSSSSNIFPGSRRPGATFGWNHLLPRSLGNYFYVNVCVSLMRAIQAHLNLLHFVLLCYIKVVFYFYKLKVRLYQPKDYDFIVVVWNQTRAVSEGCLYSVAVKNTSCRVRRTWVWAPALPLASSVVLSKSLQMSDP